MSHAQTLNALRIAIEMAERERDAARQGLHGALSAQQAAQAQLDQLQSYAQETETRWARAPTRACSRRCCSTTTSSWGACSTPRACKPR